MDEQRLIDANAFYKQLEEIRAEYIEENTMSSIFAAEIIETVQDSYLKDAPTIDPKKNGYVLRGVLDQIRWERDIAIDQLHSYGVEFGEKAEMQRVRYGEWLNPDGYDDWYCSECGFEINCDEDYPTEYDNFKYCGRCGLEWVRSDKNG